MTQPNPSIVTSPPTSDGVSPVTGSLAVSTLFAEFERRRQVSSDIVDHMLTLYSWARGWPNAHILELGVRKGNSTCAFLAALEVDRRGCLWSIDIATPEVPQEWHESPHWQFLKAHDLSGRAADFAPRELDVLFVDAEHDYGSVRAELDLYGPRVRKGGVILMHDTDEPHLSGPGTAATAYCEEHPEAEVQEFIRGCNGLGVLRIR